MKNAPLSWEIYEVSYIISFNCAYVKYFSKIFSYYYVYFAGDLYILLNVRSDERSKGTKQTKKNKPMTEDDKLKYEIASELGLLDKVKEGGWKSLTAKETGRIGGLMTKRKKEMKQQAQN